jgi:endonuclease I/V8-like Glu-specific endopeptidase
MIISTELLRETEERYRERREAREERRRQIASEGVLGANAPELVQRRLQRIARAEASGMGVSADGMALERVIGKSDLIGVIYLELGLVVSGSVGRVQVRTATGQRTGFGTGFMVSPRLLLTNNHVLGSVHEASNSRLEFNFQDDLEGRPLASVTFDLEPETFFLTDAHLDYSLVAVAEGSLDGGGATLRQFGWNRLIEEQGKAIVGEHVNIVQHPNGEPKQLALRENQIVDELEDFLHYETDTAPGSSGSPVFNDQWEVVALHHSGVPKRDEQGHLLTKEGNLWTPEMGEHRIAWSANEGARVSQIVRHIKRRSLPAGAQRRLRDEMFEATPPPFLPTLLTRPDGEEGAAQLASSSGSAAASISEDGSAVWTLPLRVSVNLGQRHDSGAATNTPALSPTARVGSASSTDAVGRPTGVAPVGDGGGETSEGDEELREALAELEAAQTRTYYDNEQDREDRDAYYGDVQESSEEDRLFEQLSDLLQRTHTEQLKYQPSKHVYPWVDLHPDLKLQSVYSGREFDPEELIREDFRIDRERAAQLQELFFAESVPTAERVARELDALEASMPFNCEHVVPQSWYDKREPMRGDLHHLFACEPDCNSFRGNIPYFDFADFEEVVREACGKREESRFEPAAGKGAVARATLYFLIRYPGEINRTMRELEPDRLRILLSWHGSDLVTEYERHRNAAIFEKQGNRNPLVDYPEWASRIDFRLGLGPSL